MRWLANASIVFWCIVAPILICRHLELLAIGIFLLVFSILFGIPGLKVLSWFVVARVTTTRSHFFYEESSKDTVILVHNDSVGIQCSVSKELDIYLLVFFFALHHHIYNSCRDNSDLKMDGGPCQSETVLGDTQDFCACR